MAVIRESLEGMLAPAVASKVIFEALEPFGGDLPSGEGLARFVENELQASLQARAGHEVARDITSRIILDACTPYEWTDKPSEIFMDRKMLQRVSERWNEYGFAGASPVAGMIDRLTRPEVTKAKGGK